MEFSSDALEALGTPGGSSGGIGGVLGRLSSVDPFGATIEAEAARYQALSAGGEGPPAYEP